MAAIRLCVVLGSAAWLAACYSPNYGDVGFECGAGGFCPDGYECRSDNLCHRIGSPDDLPDAAPQPDADPDQPDADPTQPDASIDAAIAPLNDKCNMPDLLDNLEGGTIVNAIDDADFSCGGDSAVEVFYQLNLLDAKRVTLGLNSNFDGSLVLLEADCMTVVNCVDASTGTVETLVNDNLPPGDYRIAVQGQTQGTFQLQTSLSDPIDRPPNDNCGGAIALTDGVAETLQQMDDALNNETGTCSGAPDIDVVYTFNIPGTAGVDNKRARIQVTNADFEARLILQSGTCPGTELACADNVIGVGSELLDAPDLAPGDYTVWVEAGSGTPTVFDIQLDLLDPVQPPLNDTCAAPEGLSEGTIAQGTTAGAVDDLDLVCLPSDGPDAVHQLTFGPSDQAMLVSVTPTDPVGWPVALSLRDSADCLVETDLSCVADAPASHFINQPTLAAGTYDVIVDGANGESGDYDLVYDLRPADSTFGYWMVHTTGATYTPLQGTSVPGLQIGTDGDEQSFQNIDIGFEFPFFGDPKTVLTISANGYVTFDVIPDVVDSFTNDCSLDASSPFDMIAPFWDDQFPNATTGNQGTLQTKLEGTAPNRRFSVEWANFDIISDQPVAIVDTVTTYKMVLHENGDIEFQYGPRSPPETTRACGTQHLGCSATIGLRNVDGTDNDEAMCEETTPFPEEFQAGVEVDEGHVIYFVHPR